MDEGEDDSNVDEPIDEVSLSSFGLRHRLGKSEGFMGGMRNIVNRITGFQEKKKNR